MRRIFIATGFLVALVIPTAAQQPSFSLPIDCEKAPSCLLQNYVDLDTGPERSDPFCGAATYNGHKGTDIRVRDLSELETGVPVISIADGTVLRVRDGEPDRMIETQADRDAVKGKQCGNGAVIDHGGGWTSQFCHLKKGSLAVKPGDKIKRGDAIALMGLSGDTAFPHVHVTIRKGKTVIDPMTGKPAGASCGGVRAETLWRQQATKLLAEKDSPLINAGFVGGPVSGLQLRKSEAPKAVEGGPVVFYAQFKNLLKGDRVGIIVTERGSRKPVASHTTDPLDRPKATYTAYAGRRSPGYAPNAYAATIFIKREGETVFRRDYP